MTPNLLILGASVRAAAQSACRAGYAPACADLFADVDLQACGPAIYVENYPRGLAKAAAEWPDSPWMYTGALENHPEVIHWISDERPLWGNDADAVRRVRDPWQLHECLRDSGISSPELRRAANEPPRDGRWLRKATRSAAGMQVEVWNAECQKSRVAGGSYYQAYVPGKSLGAVFVGNGTGARLLGVSTQRTLDGGFQYAGSSTVVTERDTVAEQFARIGDMLSSQIQLTGLFGVDAIFDSERLWPIEVNPRYTASVEIHERASTFHALELHAAACTRGELPVAVPLPADIHVGKTIHYAQNAFTVPASFVDWAQQQNTDRQWPKIADIPQVGTKIEAGHPVVTLLAEAETPGELRQREKQYIAEVIDELNRL